MSYEIEQTISELIPTDFPEKFKEIDSNLIDFLQGYFQWMEQPNNTINYARNLLNYRDVDKTPNNFLYHFLAKYLPGIQLTTETDVRLLIKHSLDFLRARGTARADKLFFAALYGEEANVYIPSQDIFRLSSGQWMIPTYLEITHRDINPTFIGKEIIGVNSGAKCFVEKLVKRKINQSGRLIELFYISSIKGIFQAGEILRLNSNTSLVDCPVFLGSLSNLTITSGSYDFNIGDVVNLSSFAASQGTAIVTSIENNIGSVKFTLEDGGYGYTANAQVIISNVNMTIANMEFFAANSIPYTLNNLTVFKQPLNTLSYISANGLFVNGDIISTYYSNGSLIANGTVIRTNYQNTTAGVLTIAANYGNLSACTVYYKQGNSVTANLAASGYTDVSAYGSFVAESTNTIVTYINPVGTWNIGETIYQQNSLGFIVSTATLNSYSEFGSTGTLYLTNCSSLFQSNLYIYGQNSGTISTVSDVTFQVGLYNVNNNFIAYPGNFIIEESTNAIGQVTQIFAGSGANLYVSNSLGYPETISLNTDFISQANQNALLSSNNYGFPNSIINGNTLLSALDYANITIGQLSGFVNINPGNNYTYPPFIRIVDSATDVFDQQSWILNVTNATGVFFIGELVTQNNTNMRGLVTAANSSTVSLKRLRFFDTWVSGNFTNNYILTGQDSNVTAYLQSYFIDQNTLELGNNAIVSSNVTTANGSVTGLKIIDSGFGFVQDGVVTFTSNNGLNSGSALANVSGIGYGAGYYRYNGGFASADKKLRDGVYYQEYSYDIKSALSLDVYENMLKNVLHVAGMKYFGSVIKSSTIQFDTNIQSGGYTQF